MPAENEVASSSPLGIDPVSLSVLSNRMEAICREMTHALQRAGRSAVLSMGRDFSVAIVTSNNELLASAESLPVHVLGIELQAKAMTEYHRDLKQGDAFLDNDPYVGNTHHADHTVLVPVFHNGVHVFTVCTKSHQADTGNSIPTTYFPHARDLYHEGSLNFPCVKVQREYADVEDIIRMCRRRIRVPDQWYGDYLATLGAARLGERRLHEVLNKHGADDVESFCEAWLDYSESRMRHAISSLPEITTTVEGRMDPFPGLPNGIPINADIDVLPTEGKVVIDLTRNIDCVEAGLNMTEATTISAAAAGLFNVLDPDLPHNSGSFRCLDIRLRRGAVVGIPEHPTSCSMATTVVADRVVNMIHGGLSEVLETYGVAEGGLGMSPGIGVISGNDTRKNGAPFINQIMLGQTGGPASAKADGWINYVLPVVNGLQYRDSVEVDEQKYPIFIEDQRLVADSEGAGKFRGAPAGRVVFGPLVGSMTVAYASDGRINPPRGVRGGYQGGAPSVEIVSGGQARPADMVGQITLEAGELLAARHCGGGGYGRPEDRPISSVLKDVSEGVISIDRAREIYLVSVEASDGGVLEVNNEVTAQLRGAAVPIE